MLRVRAESPDPDPVAAVETLLENIDSLQLMQDKRADFRVSSALDENSESSVAEHNAAREGYEAYLADMFAKREEAQTAYGNLSAEQKAAVDPTLLAVFAAVGLLIRKEEKA